MLEHNQNIEGYRAEQRRPRMVLEILRSLKDSMGDRIFKLLNQSKNGSSEEAKIAEAQLIPLQEKFKKLLSINPEDATVDDLVFLQTLLWEEKNADVAPDQRSQFDADQQQIIEMIHKRRVKQKEYAPSSFGEKSSEQILADVQAGKREVYEYLDIQEAIKTAEDQLRTIGHPEITVSYDETDKFLRFSDPIREKVGWIMVEMPPKISEKKFRDLISNICKLRIQQAESGENTPKEKGYGF